MSEINESRDALGEVQYSHEIRAALDAVTELPEDLEQQAEFFDKVQEALATRLREEPR